MILNQRFVLASRPVGAPQLRDIRLEAGELPALREGEALLETLWLSLDPYMRGRMSEDKSYSPPMALGDVMVGRTISRVVESRNATLAPGDVVLANSGWQTHFISDGGGLRKLAPTMRRPSLALGVLGSSGFAAYIGMLKIGQPKAGETVVVAAATGAVGAAAIQLARMQGARTVAISGDAEKVAYARDVLKADVSLDHRSADFTAQLAAAAPQGIDVYFENVGGDVLWTVLPLLNDRARVPVCGLIAWYNLAAPPDGPDRSPALLRLLLRRRLMVQGFVVSDWAAQQDEFMQQMQRWVDEGSVVYREHVVEGFANAPQAFIGLLEGRNFGKAMVKVAN